MIYVLVGMFLVVSNRPPTQISINNKTDLLAPMSEKSGCVLIKAVSQFSVIPWAVLSSACWLHPILTLVPITFSEWLPVTTRATCYLIHIQGERDCRSYNHLIKVVRFTLIGPITVARKKPNAD